MNTSDWPVSKNTADFYQHSLVWDMVYPIEPWAGNDYKKLERYQAAGVNLVSLCLAGDNHNISEAIQRIGSARREILTQPERYGLVETLDDIQRAQQSNKMAIAFHCEGTRCFERNLDMIETFYALGIRHTLLAFNNDNSVGGGCAEEHDRGLTRFGHRVVEEMQRVGMIVDLSHTGRQTSLDAMAIASKPMIFSHSVADGVHTHYRNLTDDQIKACAATGGVIGMSGSNGYLGDKQASNETLFKHIDYIAERVGPEHIGLGLDLVFDHQIVNDWIRQRPEEWPGADDPNWPGFRYAVPEQIPALAELLLAKGYSEEIVRGILGENWRRVCQQCWSNT